MAPSQADVRNWINQINREVQLFRIDGTPKEFITRLEEIQKKFSKLQKASSIDTANFLSLVAEATGVYIDRFDVTKLSKINFKDSKMLLQDSDPNTILQIQKDRLGGERDLHKLATDPKTKVEEDYLFIQWKDRKGTHSIWYEIGSEEITSSTQAKAGFNDLEALALIQRHAKKGTILEVSMYHYHPYLEEDRSKGIFQSRISIGDLISAESFTKAYAGIFTAPLDFRVANIDGMYTFSHVDLTKLRNMPDDTPNLIIPLQGTSLVSFLKKYGIDGRFDATILEQKEKKSIPH